MAKAVINQRSLSSFVSRLKSQFEEACKDTVPLVQSFTPVDTKRLYNSTRAEPAVLKDKIIECDIIAGGVSLLGETREQELRRDVDYAYWVEIKNPYIRPNLTAIGNEIVAKLLERRHSKIGRSEA